MEFFGLKNVKNLPTFSIAKSNDVDIPEEIWKIHSNGLHVSNMGRVKNLRKLINGESRLFYSKGCPDAEGYLSIFKNKKHHAIHRMVAELFLDVPS